MCAMSIWKVSKLVRLENRPKTCSRRLKSIFEEKIGSWMLVETRMSLVLTKSYILNNLQAKYIMIFLDKIRSLKWEVKK